MHVLSLIWIRERVNINAQQSAVILKQGTVPL
jgi:hypothetical protein